MIHRQSRGQLPLFVQGLEAFKRLKVGWEVGGGVLPAACSPSLHSPGQPCHRESPPNHHNGITSFLLCSAPSSLQAGDKVLVAEACNHNRITDICNDIGMVQVGVRRGPLPPSCFAVHADCSFSVHAYAYSCVALCIDGACTALSASCPPTAPSIPASALPQIPAKVSQQGGRSVTVDHAFGREFPELDAPGEDWG